MSDAEAPPAESKIKPPPQPPIKRFEEVPGLGDQQREMFKEAPRENRGAWANAFALPPYSILNTQTGWWRNRKSQWLGLGIKSEIGRGANLLQFSETALGEAELVPKEGEHRMSQDEIRRKRQLEALAAASKGQTPQMGGRPDDAGGVIPDYYIKLKAGMTKDEIIDEWRRAKTFNTQDWVKRKQADGSIPANGGLNSNFDGTSIFDPVLCELAYRWWCPPGGQVLDPFAGGSVRGIVASRSGRRYWGCDLAADQVAANRVQAAEICLPDQPVPTWINGDSLKVLTAGFGRGASGAPQMVPSADVIFSCPPYADLERYSDDPADISTMEYGAFLAAYRGIIKAACAKLKPDRFACFVVSEVRERKGENRAYLGFVPDTIAAFRDAGLAYYNDIILVNSPGSLAIRARKQWVGARKIGRHHQNVLCFLKGNAKVASALMELPMILKDEVVT